MTAPLCASCGSCGFPMSKPSDFAGGNTASPYCATCADASGALRPFEEVVEANASYLRREQGIDAQAARDLATALLLSMPAWSRPERSPH
jgi:Putative zinc ribbon domain